MRSRPGFGRYQFQVAGRLDLLDDNVVLGLFNYPAGDVGPGLYANARTIGPHADNQAAVGNTARDIAVTYNADT